MNIYKEEKRSEIDDMILYKEIKLDMKSIATEALNKCNVNRKKHINSYKPQHFG